MALNPGPNGMIQVLLQAEAVTGNFFWINGTLHPEAQQKQTGYLTPSPPLKTGDTIRVGVGVYNLTAAPGDLPEGPVDLYVYLVVQPSDDIHRYMIGQVLQVHLYNRHPGNSGVSSIYLDLIAQIPSGLISDATNSLIIDAVIASQSNPNYGWTVRVRSPDGQLTIPCQPSVIQQDLYQPPPEEITDPVPTTSDENWDTGETDQSTIGGVSDNSSLPSTAAWFESRGTGEDTELIEGEENAMIEETTEEKGLDLQMIVNIIALITTLITFIIVMEGKKHG